MRQLFGALLVVIGICFGLYIGIWWGFIGGIVAVVEAVKATEVIPSEIAYGVGRVVFCQLLGLAAGALFVLPGMVLCQE
jgi:hypothetical protein